MTSNIWVKSVDKIAHEAPFKNLSTRSRCPAWYAEDPIPGHRWPHPSSCPRTPSLFLGRRRLCLLEKRYNTEMQNGFPTDTFLKLIFVLENNLHFGD